jgi:hypothetical protein
MTLSSPGAAFLAERGSHILIHSRSFFQQNSPQKGGQLPAADFENLA